MPSRAVGDAPRVPTSRPLTPSRASLRRAEQVKLRRGLTCLGMTLLLPGSAQLATGHRRVGRLALRLWAGLAALLLLVGLAALVRPAAVVSLLSHPPVLRGVQLGLVALALAWGALLVDAWRLSRPPELAPRHRLGFAVLSGGLVLSVVGGLLASASVVSAQRDLVAAVFAGGGDQQVRDGRYTVLLLGGDAGKNRTGLRPDSITVASVDAATGRTVLVGLPRNLEGAPFPVTSPLRARFPDGFRCPDRSCLLNAVYTYATEHADLYPGVANPGAQATAEAVEGATGLPVNYWALIDLHGFEALVDAVGGITLDVNRAVPIGGGSTPISGYIEAGAQQHLDGREALWFARSRADSSDYDRMARQKCVMSAMLDQLDPVTVLTNFNAIAAAGREIVGTNIPPAEVGTMLQLAAKAKGLPVASVSAVPPLVEPGNPDFAVIRAAVQAKIDKAEAADARRTGTAASPSVAAPPVTASPAPATPRASKSYSSATERQDHDDLAAVCSA